MRDSLQSDLDHLVKKHRLAGALLCAFQARVDAKDEASMQLTVSGRVPPLPMLAKYFNGQLKERMATGVGKAVGNLIRKHLG
jgi:hypothetical protein